MTPSHPLPAHCDSQVKQTYKFSKIFKAYCRKIEWKQEDVRFLCDGKEIQKNQTPADFKLQSGDEIVAEKVGQT